jgi:hypothetical protein
MTGRKVTTSRIVIITALVALLCAAGYFAWNREWGRLSYYVQRLGHEDPEVARASEVALLELGPQGRVELCKFLISKLDIKLPHMSFDEDSESGAMKVVAVSASGEVDVAGVAGPVKEIVLLADGATSVEKLCLPERARRRPRSPPDRASPRSPRLKSSSFPTVPTR